MSSGAALSEAIDAVPEVTERFPPPATARVHAEAAPPDSSPSVRPLTQTLRVPPPTPSTAADLPEALTPSSEVSTPPPPSAAPAAKPKPQPKPRVMVLFFLKGASHGEIRIAGRVVPVETVATLNLRPGHYMTKWRRRGEDEWHDAGKVKVPALDPEAEFSEVRLDVDGYRGITRPIPTQRGPR